MSHFFFPTSSGIPTTHPSNCMSSFLSFLNNPLSPVSTFHTCIDVWHPQGMGNLIVPIPSKKNASLSFSIYQLPKPSGDWVEPRNFHKLLPSLCQNFDSVCVLCTQLKLLRVHKYSGPGDSISSIARHSSPSSVSMFLLTPLYV